MADDSNHNRSVRLLCLPKHLLTGSDPGTHWLIGSPFFPPLTIASILHSSSPDLYKESDELRTLIPKGFEVIGALAYGNYAVARAAFDAACGLRKLLYGENHREVIGAVAGSDSGEVLFFVSECGNVKSLELVMAVVEEVNSEKFVWENGSLLRCELPIKLPPYFPVKNPTGLNNESGGAEARNVKTFHCHQDNDCHCIGEICDTNNFKCVCYLPPCYCE